MSILSKDGFKSLRWVYGITLAGIGVAAFLTAGSYLYWESEKKNNVTATQNVRDLRARLEAAKRERDDLRDSEQTYKALTARGVFLPEDRLELIEAMSELKRRHRLIGLDYEMSAQRVLKLAGGIVYPAVDAMGSRIKMKIRAYHDGDLTSFLDDFPRMQRGFFPIDRCVIRRASDFDRLSAATTAVPAARTAIGKVARVEAPAAIAKKPDEKPPISALIEAECSLEWITLLDKRAIPLPPPPVRVTP